jgi:hypothetical protein
VQSALEFHSWEKELVQGQQSDWVRYAAEKRTQKETERQEKVTKNEKGAAMFRERERVCVFESKKERARPHKALVRLRKKGERRNMRRTCVTWKH